MEKFQLVLALILVYHLIIIKVDAQLNYVNKGCVDTNFNFSHGSVYEENLGVLLSNLSSKSSSFEFYYYTVGSGTNQVYGIYQCRDDLSHNVCSECVKDATRKIVQVCPLFAEANVWYYECRLRYANRNIFSLVGQSSPSPVRRSVIDNAPQTGKTRPLKPEINIAIAVCAALGLLVLSLSLVLWYCLCGRNSRKASRRKPAKPLEGLHNGNMDDITSLESLQFGFQEVKDATSNFSDENKLGQGGFGMVYKGTLLNGEEIAVKRLSTNSQQGTIEFKNEVLLVAKLQHRNLVKLLGFCISGKEKILIYEFLSNSSLDHFLFDPTKRASLGWELRFRIITGIARGLLYLHEDSRLKIIHRDLKSSNILLDDAMDAKIADFGLAKLFDLDQTQGDTMRIAGTFGYMAPEYAMAGQFSVKSDVYSFGVIVLEIVSGQRNSYSHRQPNEEGLLQRAWRLWNEDARLELVDSLLGNVFSEEEAKLCILIGLLCVQEDAAHRPRMASVIAALNGQSITLPLPNTPHFFTISSMTDVTTSNNNYSVPGTHTGTMSVTELCPR